MPIQNPPQVDDAPTSAWLFESTEKINELEFRFNTLIEFIKTSTDLADLQEKVKRL